MSIVVAIVVPPEKGEEKWPIILQKTQMLARNLLYKIHAKLIEYVKKIIFSEEFIHCHRSSDKAFIRKRCLPFPTVIFFLSNLVKGSIQDELNRFFQVIRGRDIPEKEVTKSAFCKARKKLSFQAFVELTQHVVDFFYGNYDVRKWHGFRLLGIDGSTARIPDTKEVAEHFGVWNADQEHPCPLARVSQLFDVQNKVTVDAILAPKEHGERNLAACHMDHVGPGDLLLLDRGYHAFWLFDLIVATGAHFCARVPVKSRKVIKSFYHSGKREKVISLPPSGQSIKEYRDMGMKAHPLKLRLLRIDLPGGETEILITSLLDKDDYPHELFKDLYHLRWPVEEDYKKMKCRVEIENFSGKSVESVYQDFHAKVFTSNLIASLVHPTQQVIQETYSNRMHPYQINLAQTISTMKDTVVLLFTRANVSELISSLLKLFIEAVEPIREGRKYPRKKGVKLQGFYRCYKPAR